MVTFASEFSLNLEHGLFSVGLNVHGHLTPARVASGPSAVLNFVKN